MFVCVAVASDTSEAGKAEAAMASGDKAINVPKEYSGIVAATTASGDSDCTPSAAFNVMTSVLQLR